MDQLQAGRLTLVAVLLAYAYYTVWVLVVVSGAPCTGRQRR